MNIASLLNPIEKSCDPIKTEETSCQNSPLDQKIIFTSVYAFKGLVSSHKGLSLRSPNLDEAEFSRRKLYLGGTCDLDTSNIFEAFRSQKKQDSQDDEFSIIKKGDLRKHHFVILAKEGEKNPLGMIHYYIQPSLQKCKIKSLAVDSKHQDLEFGQILLSNALIEAQQNACRIVKLITDGETAGFLYTSFGFIPDDENLNLKEWENLSFEQKWKANWDNNLLVLNLDHPPVVQHVNAKIREIFDKQTQQNKSHEKINLNTIKLPETLFRT